MNKSESFETLATNADLSQAVVGYVADILTEEVAPTISKASPVAPVRFATVDSTAQAVREGRHPNMNDRVGVA